MSECVAAGGDGLGVAAQLLLEAADHALHHLDVAVEQARLEGLDGVLADGAAGGRELDAAELCRAVVQGLGGDADAGGDGAAEVLTLAVDGVEDRGGAEVDHHRRPAVESDTPRRSRRCGLRRRRGGCRSGCGRRCGCPVPTTSGVVLKASRVAAWKTVVRGGTTLHRTTSRHLLRGDPLQRQQRAEEDAVLVGHLVGIGGDAPRRLQRRRCGRRPG